MSYKSAKQIAAVAKAKGLVSLEKFLETNQIDSAALEGFIKVPVMLTGIDMNTRGQLGTLYMKMMEEIPAGDIEQTSIPSIPNTQGINKMILLLKLFKFITSA
jgi:hypothetical protein